MWARGYAISLAAMIVWLAPVRESVDACCRQWSCGKLTLPEDNTKTRPTGADELTAGRSAFDHHIADRAPPGPGITGVPREDRKGIHATKVGLKMDTLMRMQSLYDISQNRKREKTIRVRRFHVPANIHPLVR